jgi:hypothetical protein
MRAKRNVVARYERADPDELARITKVFDEEMFIDRSRPLTESERREWETRRRKPGRPRRGAGVKVVSVSVERTLLSQSDALARRLGISRASLIERGLRQILIQATRRGAAKAGV